MGCLGLNQGGVHLIQEPYPIHYISGPVELFSICLRDNKLFKKNSNTCIFSNELINLLLHELKKNYIISMSACKIESASLSRNVK